MPRGFQKEGGSLKLYRVRQSPRNFFEHLTENLFRTGLVQPEGDPCHFISKKVLI